MWLAIEPWFVMMVDVPLQGIIYNLGLITKMRFILLPSSMNIRETSYLSITAGNTIVECPDRGT
jgi:hypothetical protein